MDELPQRLALWRGRRAWMFRGGFSSYFQYYCHCLIDILRLSLDTNTFIVLFVSLLFEVVLVLGGPDELRESES